MPRPVTLLDPVPQCPDVSNLSWWDEFRPAWTDVVAQRPVDVIRTDALVDWNQRVRVSGNTPLQRAATTYTTTLTTKTPGTLANPFPSVKVPLPAKVWISSNNDHTWFGVDPVRKWYWEASSLGPVLSFLQSPWRSDVVRVFNLQKNWTEQPGSISASRIPVWPLVPTIEGLDAGAGGVQHALAFVAAGYGDGPVQYPSRGTDGYIPGHPLVNGSRLRLTRKAVERLTAQSKSPQDAAVVWALEQYGCLCVDKTSEDAGHSLRFPKDPRLKVSLALQLTDFDVLF